MFEVVQTAPPDPILGLTEAFKRDPNPRKINLSVGVYQDASGRTPILKCVKEAERRLLEDETSKGYLGIDGSPEYTSHVQRLVFGPDMDVQQLATVQVPGGTGGLRVAADFIQKQFPHATVWCSQPTWVNHPHIFQAAHLRVEFYSYLNQAGRDIDFEAMLQSLERAAPGDVVCLHACCHNPSGIDPTQQQWEQIAQVIRNRQLLALVDFAYQGFGDGLREDAIGVRALRDIGAEILVCSSFSKNFGLYAERVGALSVLAASPAAAQAVLSQLKVTVRANYSNPPKHGAAIVSRVLSDGDLHTQWEQELADMRGRIHHMRALFVKTLRELDVKKDFSFLLNQRGMFSFSGLTPLQVDELRSKYAIYIVSSGRINVAGMTEANMGPLCQAIREILATE